MAITTKIETITVTSTIHHAGSTIAEKGTIRVRMPSNYNPAFVTADDIENDPALEIVGDEPEPMDTTTITITHDGTEYTVTLHADKRVTVERHSPGLREVVANQGRWNGAAVEDDPAVLGDELWDAVDAACYEMED